MPPEVEEEIVVGAEVSEDDVNEFETMLAEDDDDLSAEIVENTQAEEVAEVVEPVKKEGTEAATEGEEAPKTELEAEAATTEVVEELKAEEVVTTPEVEETVGLGPEELEAQAQQLQQFTAQAEDLLAKQIYQLDDEQVAALEDDPKVAFPKYAAKLHMQIMQAATQNVARLLPQMMQTITTQQTASQQHENQFMEAWPDLKEDGEAIMRVGAVYRQMNPKATAEDFIRDVGAQVMVALGKHNLAPVVEETSPRALTPHKPAGRGTGAKAMPVAETNEFALMSEELD